MIDRRHISFFPLVLMLGAIGQVYAEAPTMEDLWKVIQQQQKDIAAMKAKLEASEAGQQAMKAEVRKLKESEKAAPVVAQQAAADSHAPAQPTDSATAISAQAKGKSDVERKTDVLAREVEKLKTTLLIPEKREYESVYGMAPAASQVYMNKSGLSLGGYGEAFYTNFQNTDAVTLNDQGERVAADDKNRMDLARAVIYAGYKFNDWIVLNNEIEFEHGTTGEGSEEKGEVSVEFSYLDFLLHKNANVRAGLMLVPMGFINEIHEPLFFFGNRRPDVERYIIPTTWREMGAGLHGEIIPGLNYRMYLMNGLNAEGFGSMGIREGKQGGSLSLAEDLAYTGRIDYFPDFARGLQLGASTFVGNAGQGQEYWINPQQFLAPKVFTQLYEGHVQWHYQGFEFRALGAFGNVGNADVLSLAKGETVGGSNYGFYVEGGYDIMPWLWRDSSQYLAPFFRFERYNTIASTPNGLPETYTQNDGFYDRTIYQAGFSYKPHQNIVIKADYRNLNSYIGQLPSEFNLGLGFIY